MVAADRRLVGGLFRLAKVRDCASILSRLEVPREPQWDTPINSRREHAKHCCDVGHPYTGILQADACNGIVLAVVAGHRDDEKWSGRVLGRGCEVSRFRHRVVLRSARSLHSKVCPITHMGEEGVVRVLSNTFYVGYNARRCDVVKGADCDCPGQHV